MKEVLRLNPVIPDVRRFPEEPTLIGVRHRPAGVVAAPAIYLTHQRAGTWSEAGVFRPERFLGTRPPPHPAAASAAASAWRSPSPR